MSIPVNVETTIVSIITTTTTTTSLAPSTGVNEFHKDPSALDTQQHTKIMHDTSSNDKGTLYPAASTIRPGSAYPHASSGRTAPRRMSMSDRDAITRAFELHHTGKTSKVPVSVTTIPASRPSTAEQKRRSATRQQIQTTQSIATEGGLKEEELTEVFCTNYSPNDRFLVTGCGDGSIRIFSVLDNHLKRILQPIQDKEHLPVTCIRFFPTEDKSDGETKFISASADGSVNHWILDVEGVGQCFRHTNSTINSVYAVDYNMDGSQYATGGRDHVVRWYDEETDQLIREGDNTGAHGHSNRIFAIKYHPTEPHLILTAGWDNTVQFWDNRTGFSERSIFGPHICGDAMDIHENGTTILTGSWRDEADALQEWDFGSGKLIRNIQWNKESNDTSFSSSSSSSSSSSPPPPRYCMLYAACYSPDGSMIGAGGAGNGINQCKLFDCVSGEILERVSHPHGIYAMSFSHAGNKWAMGGVDPYVTLVNLRQ